MVMEIMDEDNDNFCGDDDDEDDDVFLVCRRRLCFRMTMVLV